MALAVTFVSISPHHHEHRDDEQRETARHANVGNIEHREIEETELDEIDDIPLHEPIDGVPDSTGDNECKSYRLQSARLLDRRKEKHSDCKANYQRKDTQPKRRIGEYSPSTTRVVHKPDIDKPQEGTCQYAARLHVGEMVFCELVNQHP